MYSRAMNNKSELTTEQKERLVAFIDALMEADFDNENSKQAKEYEDK